jgi:hypothetical protein
MLDTANRGSLRGVWYWAVVFLLIGYLCMGRSFAYWGIPPWHVFIGEIALLCFLFWGPLSARGRWPWVAANSSMLRRFNILLLISLLFGVFQVLHGIWLGYPVLSAVRDLAFDYYPVYFFLGVWIASRERDFLPRFFYVAGLANGIYGIFYILLLSRIDWFFPGVSQEVAPVPIFGQPMFSGAIILGLLSTQKNPLRILPLLLLNTAVLLGMVTRGEWLAFGVGLFIWACLTRNLKSLALGGAMVIVLLGALYVTGFEIQAPEGRGGTISATDLYGRILAPFDKDLAADYTTDAQLHEDTAAFRTLWWIAIWDSVHSSVSQSLFGYGYGYALGDLVPYLEGHFIRTPHNVFFYALGYTGWVGVLIFGLLLAEIGRLSWRVYRRDSQSFAIVFWIDMLAYSLFTAFFEVPYGAIPFFVVAGCACAPLLSAERLMPSVVSGSVNRARMLNPLPDTAG